jgi:hypothetical protein
MVQSQNGNCLRFLATAEECEATRAANQVVTNGFQSVLRQVTGLEGSQFCLCRASVPTWKIIVWAHCCFSLRAATPFACRVELSDTGPLLTRAAAKFFRALMS